MNAELGVLSHVLLINSQNLHGCLPANRFAENKMATLPLSSNAQRGRHPGPAQSEDWRM